MQRSEILNADQATSPKDWVFVGQEKAKQHKLYGPKNWLAVFAFGLVMTPLREWADAQAIARDYGVTLGELLTLQPEFDTYFTLVMAQQLIICGGLLWMMFTKHPKFRLTASVALLASYPMIVVWAGVSGMSGAGKGLALMLFPWLIGCAVWVTYLNRSRRVRVTYEHKVRAAEVWAEQRVPTPTLESDSYSEPTTGQQKGPAEPQPRVTRLTPASHQEPSVTLEEDLWACALREFESSERREGLWAKAFAQSGGNEAAAKAQYLRERVEQLRIG